VNRGQPAPASQGPEITTTESLENYNILAAFRTMDDASKAIEALGLAGIEGHRITLQGDSPDEASRQVDVAEADSHLMSRWFARSTLWGVGGAVIGFVLGVPVGIAILEAYDQGLGATQVIGSALLGALFLGLIAWLIGVFYYVQAGETWELSYHQTPADIAIVGVHSSNAKDVERARAILQKRGSIRLRTAGSAENPREAIDRTRRTA